MPSSQMLVHGEAVRLGVCPAGIRSYLGPVFLSLCPNSSPLEWEWSLCAIEELCNLFPTLSS